MDHQGTLMLQSPRLILRAFTMADREPMFRNWESDPEVTKFLRWPPAHSSFVTADVLASWISQYEDPTFYQWAIVPRDLGEPIGSISAVDQEEKTAKIHIGYCIGRNWWHMGYTSEALATVIPFFFEQVKANRIESQHDPNNPNSGAVMRKCGLTYEGTLRQADWSNQGIVDAAMYGLLAEDYFRSRSL